MNKKIIAFLLTLLVVVSLAGCNTRKTNTILEAWTGDFSEDKLEKTIKEYRRNHTPIVMEGKDITPTVSFEVDFEISAYSVARLSRVDNKDIDAELRGYIDLSIGMKCQDKKVTISTDWWYINNGSWVTSNQIWSYLIRLKDMDGMDHYYYFRVDYRNNIAE